MNNSDTIKRIYFCEIVKKLTVNLCFANYYLFFSLRNIFEEVYFYFSLVGINID